MPGQHDFRMRLHPGGLHFELLGVPGIVGIEEGDELLRRLLPAGVAGGTGATISK
ncbi:hypothetical protein D3C83_185480 [compost metagenome]